MLTGQKYGEGDSLANKVESTAKTIPAAPYTPPTPSQQLETLVADFLSESTASENLSVLNELLFVWQDKQAKKADRTHACNVNFKTMRIGQFLVELQEVGQRVRKENNLLTSNGAE